VPFVSKKLLNVVFKFRIRYFNRFFSPPKRSWRRENKKVLKRETGNIVHNEKEKVKGNF